MFNKEKDMRVSRSGIEIPLVATPADIAKIDFTRDLGFPGEPPYVRGPYATMYRGQLPTARMYAGYETAVKTNERFRLLLKQGQNGLSIAFDLPTQIGYDPDDHRAAGEPGRVGVSVSTLDDMRQLMQAIPLDKVSTSMTINATASTLFAMYELIAKENGVSSKELRGTVQNDPLKEFIARGTQRYPPGASLRLALDLYEYCLYEAPQWNAFSVSGYHMGEAGATAVDELAFSIANALEYMRGVRGRGLDDEEFASRVSFFFRVGNDFFEEIAKFRAARKLWHERTGKPLRFHAQTSGVTLTAQQPENNIVRVTYQALAAYLGGAQSIHTNSMDEALALPAAKSALVALRTQQIIAEETGVTNTVDPLGGAFEVERRTVEIYKRALEEVRNIEDQGGALKALEEGYQQGKIEDSAYAYQTALEKGTVHVVGVNIHTSDVKQTIQLQRHDELLEETLRQRVVAYRKTKSRTRVGAALNHLKDVSGTKENTLPAILEAVNSGATVGEISGAMEEVFEESSG